MIFCIGRFFFFFFYDLEFDSVKWIKYNEVFSCRLQILCKFFILVLFLNKYNRNTFYILHSCTKN